MKCLTLNGKFNATYTSLPVTSDRIYLFILATILCFCSLVPPSVQGQSSAAFKRQGDQYFEKKQYRSALHAYRQGGLENTTDKKQKEKIGICLYEINDVEGAIKIFQALINEGKTEPTVFLHAAKSYASIARFSEANVYYKKFLQTARSNDPLRPWVKDELIRCANGMRLVYADEIAYIENAGTTINTQYSEFGVRTSPTTIDKIYFNTDRTDVAMAKSASGNVDIYTTTPSNGRWNVPFALPGNINSPGFDQVVGFSNNGQVLYYLTGEGKNFVIKTDTFTTETDQTHRGTFEGPFLTSHGGSDLFFFNDTICLFSSNRPGGYGGYDLYISLFTQGAWSKPANLGPAINSFYNDRFPFLTRDGLTLYYSSDNLQSMGGFDVFFSTFDTEASAWGYPVNPGYPFNSPLDDTYPILSQDGMTGYLSSNRKEGYGEYDIYRIFFKKPIDAHQQISAIPTFYQRQLLAGNNNATPNNVVPTPVEIKEFYISHLFIEEGGEILSPQNNRKLDLLVNLLLIYPKIKAELSCFELSSGQRAFSIYFSIKKAEKVAEYLASKGIQKNRLILKGYGDSFPLVLKPAGSVPSPVYQKLNQRLEINILDYLNEPVIITTEKIKVPENLQDPKGLKYNSYRHSLYYSVQFASVSQILQNEAIEPIEELYIEVDHTRGHYLYMAGMSPTYKEAEKVLATLVEIGFPDARIVPYINGKRIPSDAVTDLATEYPDLLQYLAAKKK